MLDATMPVFELVILLLFVGAVLAMAAQRLHAPYPALLALAGAGLALVPGVPTVVLDPELALALFVAPVLLDAAFDASPRDLKRNWPTVTSLALPAVGLTVAAVAVVARALVPDLSWAAAIALGAIVAPPDAAAAMAVLRQLHPPHRVLVILEGESLFNDATALLIYRLAVAAAITGTFSPARALPMFLLVCAGSVALGVVLAHLVGALVPRMRDLSIAVIVQFLSTFAVWIAAERLHLSGILTVVVFAIRVARTTPERTPARLRIPTYAVWEVAVFVLNVLAFILVGLQLKPIVAELEPGELAALAGTAAAVCATVIAVRFVWVAIHELAARALAGRRRGDAVPGAFPSPRGAVVISWSGMRGIVTLAAALALPHDFAHRGVVLFIAFAVVLVTLVVQGMTLRPLMRRLAITDDGAVEREVRLARAETARAAIATLDGGGETLLVALRRKYEARLGSGDAGGGATAPDDLDAYLTAAARAQRAERATLARLRATGVIGDDAFHRVEEELDWAEVNVQTMAATR